MARATPRIGNAVGIGIPTRPTVTVWPTVPDVQRHVSDHPRLHLLLKEAVQGADAALWNGQSRAPEGVDFTVLDVHDLVDASDPVRRARVACGPQHAPGARVPTRPEQADQEVPREPGGRHANAIDFLAPELARFGWPVLDNASTKLLVRQEARDLEALRHLLNLHEAELRVTPPRNPRRGPSDRRESAPPRTHRGRTSGRAPGLDMNTCHAYAVRFRGGGMSRARPTR